MLPRVMGIIWARGFVPAWACHVLGPQSHLCLLLLSRNEDLGRFASGGLGYRPVQINLRRQLPCFGSWSSEITILPPLPQQLFALALGPQGGPQAHTQRQLHLLA